MQTSRKQKVRVVGSFDIPEEEKTGGLDSMNEYIGYNWPGASELRMQSQELAPLYDYAQSELERHGLPVPPRMFLENVVFAAFSYYDIYCIYAIIDPLLTGIEFTNEWREHTYDIKLMNGKTETLKPHLVETYRYTPGADINVVNYMTSRPGINGIDASYGIRSFNTFRSQNLHMDHDTCRSAFIDEVNRIRNEMDPADRSVSASYSEVWDSVCGENHGESVTEWFTEALNQSSRDFDMFEAAEARKFLDFCGRRMAGSPEHCDAKGFHLDLLDMHDSHTDMLTSVVSCLAWSFMCYYFGPLGRELRSHNQIYHEISQYNECILVDCNFYGPDSYVKTELHPHACMICGIISFCVETCQLAEGARNICEADLNGKDPIFPMATCGTKACMLVECPNHCMHGQCSTTLDYLRQHGQLHGYIQKMNNPDVQIGYEEVKQVGYCF